MIRTVVVALTVIPGFAYRKRLSIGGSGIVILRPGTAQPGLAGISRTTGEPVLSENTPTALFPIEAFREAAELTRGLPYRNLTGVKLVLDQPAEAPEVVEDSLPEEAAAVSSEEYNAVVRKYTDSEGRLSYDLLNRDLIRFAHRSSTVRAMASAGEGVDAIRLYITGTKFRSITKNNNLTDAQILRISALLDEAYPRGVFQELNKELRRMIGKG